MGTTDPVEAVQPRSWMVYPDASFLAQVAIDLVFPAQTCLRGMINQFSVCFDLS